MYYHTEELLEIPYILVLEFPPCVMCGLTLVEFDDQQSSYLQLEPVLLDVSHTGIVRFPWKLIRPLLRYKLKSVLGEAFGTSKNIPDDDKDLSRQILERFDKFSG